jgi:hypothetical protein
MDRHSDGEFFSSVDVWFSTEVVQELLRMIRSQEFWIGSSI